jgi:hypothetical protein
MALPPRPCRVGEAFSSTYFRPKSDRHYRQWHKGQALAGVAIGGIGEGDLGQAAVFGDGGVAFENLPEEEVGGNHGGQAALAEGQFEFVADGADEGSIDELSGAALDALQGLGHTEHGGLLALRESEQPHNGRRPSPLPG